MDNSLSGFEYVIKEFKSQIDVEKIEKEAKDMLREKADYGIHKNCTIKQLEFTNNSLLVSFRNEQGLYCSQKITISDYDKIKEAVDFINSFRLTEPVCFIEPEQFAEQVRFFYGLTKDLFIFDVFYCKEDGIDKTHIIGKGVANARV